MIRDNRCPSCVIADEKVTAASRQAAMFADQAAFARECAIVALRMLRRAGKLTPTTDDERAAVELAGYMLDLPAAQRRLLHPLTEDYVKTSAEVGQQLLFDTSSQESVEEAA